MLNYLKDNYNFKRYSEKTKLLCKLNLSIVIIMIVKMEKIKDCDEVYDSNCCNESEGIESSYCTNKKYLRDQYNRIIDDKIVDIISSIIEYKYYYPKYFVTFLLKCLNNFIDYNI
jgi:uncharacterized protein YpmS